MIDVAVYNTINGRFLHAIEINKNKNKINYISWTPCVPIYKDLYGEHTHQKKHMSQFLSAKYNDDTLLWCLFWASRIRGVGQTIFPFPLPRFMTFTMSPTNEDSDRLRRANSTIFLQFLAIWINFSRTSFISTVLD